MNMEQEKLKLPETGVLEVNWLVKRRLTIPEYGVSLERRWEQLN